MGMTLTKAFVNNCRNIGALRDFLCQAMDQVDEKDKEIAELKESQRWRRFGEEDPDSDVKQYLVYDARTRKYGKSFYSFIMKSFQYDVTHWMPLPKEPEDK